ncbi:MAG: hypothetical protein ACHP7D_08920, partial [Lysobacterales bacterium]
GEIEGAEFETLPPAQPSVGRLLHAYPPLQLAILGLPWLALLVLLLRPGIRIGSRALDYAAISVAGMLGTFVITVLGDGLADTAKQGHLVVNAALAWLIVAILMGCGRSLRTAMAAGSASN